LSDPTAVSGLSAALSPEAIFVLVWYVDGCAVLALIGALESLAGATK